jgi:hypothetical protein
MAQEDEVINIPEATERDPRVYDPWRSGFRTDQFPVDEDLGARQREKFFRMESCRPVDRVEHGCGIAPS